MRFSDAHSPGAVCVPSRYGLMTGRYPFRQNGNPDKGALIEPGRMTIASLLKANGYPTAMIGKWHLGFQGGTNFDCGKPLRGGPADCGFDLFFGQHASLDIPPYFYIQNDHCVGPPTKPVGAGSTPEWSPIQGAFWRAGSIAPDFKMPEVLADYTRRAVDYIGRAARNEKPFFLYVAFTAPHTPWLPSREFGGKSSAGLYGDFVMQLDHAIEEIVAALARAGLSDNTLVFFTSDNGPTWYPADVQRFDHSSAYHFRGMKGDAWEGGHRVPFIARWPGRIKPGSESGETIVFTDFLATFAAVLGAKLPENAGEDSVSFLSLLLGGKPGKPHDVTVIESSRRVPAIRQGDWKLIPILGSGGFTQPSMVKPEPGEVPGQLYNLASDPAEQTNVYARNPEVVARLAALLEKCRRDGRSAPTLR